MSTPSEDRTPPDTGKDSESVLANLPRTRPQRSSARRLAARASTSENGAVASPSPAAEGAPANGGATRSGSTEKKSAAPRGPRVGSAGGKQRARRASARPAGAAPASEPAPAQGFECETDRASGPVQPPGSSELAASALEIVGELAKAGLSSGERLLKDVLARLPGS